MGTAYSTVFAYEEGPPNYVVYPLGVLAWTETDYELTVDGELVSKLVAARPALARPGMGGTRPARGRRPRHLVAST